MPATRASSARPRRQYTPLAAPQSVDENVIILSSDDDEPLKNKVAPSRKVRSKQKSRAPIPPSAEVVEISDDEDMPSKPKSVQRMKQDAPASLQRQLKEALEEVERLRKEARVAEKQKMAAPSSDAKLLSDLEENITCEICTLKMWAPFALPCGHTFCQTCLQDWFGTTQAQHMANHPQNGMANGHLQAYRTALRNPNHPLPVRREIEETIRQLEATLPQPQYTCPTCRSVCKARPTEVFAIKSIVESVARATGESAPQKLVNAQPKTRGAAARIVEGPFDGFFPPSQPKTHVGAGAAW